MRSIFNLFIGFEHSKHFKNHLIITMESIIHREKVLLSLGFTHIENIHKLFTWKKCLIRELNGAA